MKLSSLKIFSPSKTDKDSSPTEQSFTSRRIDDKATERCSQNLKVSAIFNSIIFVVGTFLYATNWLTYVWPVHPVIVLLSGFGLFAMHKGRRGFAKVALISGDLLGILAMSFACYLNRSANLQSEIVLGESALMIISFYNILLSPFSKRILFFFVTTLILASVPSLFTTGGISRQSIPLLVHITAMMTAGVFRQRQHISEVLQFSLDYQLMRRIAPKQIVHRAIEADRNVDELFAPDDRFCICICSDWRAYQELTRTLAPYQIVSALESYYELTESLLQEHFPSGNYFSDWIADELFVVAFCDNSYSEQKLLAQQAVNFSKHLLEAKAARLKQDLPPKAIDVGIACGNASVGIIGPKHHRKATALGEIPGRSRRIQTTSKILRDTLGHQDRVILGADLYSFLDKKNNFESFALPKNQKIKDLTDDTLFYFEVSNQRVLDIAS